MTIDEIKEKVNGQEYEFLKNDEHLGSNIILLGLGTSMVPHILMQCATGKSSIGSVQNLSTVQNFSMECWKL